VVGQDQALCAQGVDRINQGAQIGRIVQLQIRLLVDQLAQSEITLEVTPRALQAIANEGYDPLYGARPLKRVIQQRIQNPLATELLKGDVGAGRGVRIDYEQDGFTFAHFAPQTDQSDASQTAETIA